MNPALSNFREYLSASRHLRDALAVNRSDGEFVNQNQSQNEIFYIFDSNIVINFVKREHSAVTGQLSTSALFAPRAKELNGELTLRYLFSGHLPGQRSRTAYLSPSHWDEALNLLHRDLKHESIASDRIGDASFGQTLDATLRPILQTLEEEVDPRELLKRAEAAGVPQQILTWVHKYVTMNLRADSAFRGNGGRAPSVQDLNNAREYWPLAMNTIRMPDYRFWSQELRKAWISIEGQEAGKRGASIDSDAYTLAAIQALHLQNPTSAPPRSKVRFVFVTANRAIIRAVQSNTKLLSSEGIPNFLRHPSVYTPLLNYSDMAAGLGNETDSPADGRVRSVFSEVERTLKTLLPVDLDNSKTSSHSRTKYYEPDIAQNIRLWSETADQLSTINIRYFFDDILHLSNASRQIVQLLSGPDIYVAGATLISDTLIQIRADHVKQVSAVLLEQLATVATSIDGDRDTSARAVPKLIGINLLAPIGDFLTKQEEQIGTLGELLTLIRRHRNGRSSLLTKLVTALEKTWDDPKHFGEAQLLATCIYADRGAWESVYHAARLCSERASDRTFARAVPPEKLKIIRREADYCKCLAVRFSLRSRSEISMAETTLSGSIARQIYNRSLATPRDISELATLMLTASILQVVENITPNENFGVDGQPVNIIDTNSIHSKFNDSTSSMLASFENFESFEGISADRQTPHLSFVADLIRLQLATNLLGAAVFAYILPRGMLSDEVTTLTTINTAIHRLRSELATTSVPRTSPTISELYLAAGEFLNAQNPTTADNLKKLIALMRSGPISLSIADKAELNYIERDVNARLVPRSPRA